MHSVPQHLIDEADARTTYKPLYANVGRIRLWPITDEDRSNAREQVNKFYRKHISGRYDHYRDFQKEVGYFNEVGEFFTHGRFAGMSYYQIKKKLAEEKEEACRVHRLNHWRAREVAEAEKAQAREKEAEEEARRITELGMRDLVFPTDAAPESDELRELQSALYYRAKLNTDPEVKKLINQNAFAVQRYRMYENYPYPFPEGMPVFQAQPRPEEPVRR